MLLVTSHISLPSSFLISEVTNSPPQSGCFLLLSLIMLILHVKKDVKSFMDTENIELNDEIIDEPEEEILEEDTEGEEGDDVLEDSTSEDDSEEEESEEEEVEEESEDFGSELRPVAGETPRELALRKKILKQTRELQALKQKEIFVSKTSTTNSSLTREDAELLSQFDEEQLSAFDKLFEIKAKQHGYVKKEEIEAQRYNETGDDILKNFIEEHPEYSEDNDPDGAVWESLKEEIELYKKPSNPRDLQKVLERAHRNIFGDIEPVKQTNINKIKAQQKKLSVASHAGSSTGTPSRKQSAPSGLRVDALRGFSQEDLQDMGLV